MGPTSQNRVPKKKNAFNDEGRCHQTYANSGLKVNDNGGIYTHGKVYNIEIVALIIEKYEEFIVTYCDCFGPTQEVA